MITLNTFIGEIPRVAPRLLPDAAAQIAKNCKLLNGEIVPLRHPANFRVLAPGNVCFYRAGNVWFEWNKVVDIVPAPIADNRLYMTGDGAPKIITDSSTVYPLAVRAPASALVASVSGTPDPATQETVIYTYTYVTAYDEESMPAPASNEVLRSGGMDVTLTGFEAPPNDRNYNRIRIYRSQTSASGVTQFYLIAEVVLPVPSPSWLDIVEENPIQEAIVSTDYNPPPDDLDGIIALPNGMMAGFVGNKLYFSEPYIPHAWPEKYMLTTNFDIVGLGAFGRSIAIMTSGTPYIATGVTPDAMAMEHLEVNFPCINAQGIVDLGYSVAYPSPDGLVVISSQGAHLASRNLMTRDQWQRLSPETIIAAQFDGRYLMSYSGTTEAGATDAGTLIIDMTGETPFLTRTDITTPYMFFEVGAGKLFIRDGQNVKQWDAPTQPFMEMTWRSKKIVLDGPINLGASQVDAASQQSSDVGPVYASIEDAVFVPATFETTLIAGETITPSDQGLQFQATVYADGSAVRAFTDISKPSRLPGGFMARTWEIEVKGKRTISTIYLAWSPSELYAGAR